MDSAEIKKVLDAPKKTVSDVMSVGGVHIRKGQIFSVTGTCLADSKGNTYSVQVLRRTPGTTDELYVVQNRSEDRDIHRGAWPQWCLPLGQAQEETWVLVFYPKGDLVLGEEFVQTRVQMAVKPPAPHPPKVDDYTLFKRYFHPMADGTFDYRVDIYATDGKNLPPIASTPK